MNNRIKELAEQAKCYADENNAHYLQNPHWIETFEEKLAELIVKECCDVGIAQKKWVENQEVFDPRDDHWNLARIQQSQRIVDKIREHFGVEE